VFSGLHVFQGIAQMAAGTGITRVSFSVFNREHTCALLADGTLRCWGFNGQGQLGNGTTTTETSPVAVNSFIANVDPAGTLRNRRVAEVTVLIDCADGGASIRFRLVQGSVTGTGHAEARCTGDLLRVPMKIRAGGPSGWEAGAATAEVEAIIRAEGRVTEDTHWTREVTISPGS